MNAVGCVCTRVCFACGVRRWMVGRLCNDQNWGKTRGTPLPLNQHLREGKVGGEDGISRKVGFGGCGLKGGES